MSLDLKEVLTQQKRSRKNLPAHRDSNKSLHKNNALSQSVNNREKMLYLAELKSQYEES